jgi:hypothetical protein
MEAEHSAASGFKLTCSGNAQTTLIIFRESVNKKASLIRLA